MLMKMTIKMKMAMTINDDDEQISDDDQILDDDDQISDVYW